MMKGARGHGDLLSVLRAGGEPRDAGHGRELHPWAEHGRQRRDQRQPRGLLLGAARRRAAPFQLPAVAGAQQQQRRHQQQQGVQQPWPSLP